MLVIVIFEEEYIHCSTHQPIRKFLSKYNARGVDKFAILKR